MTQLATEQSAWVASFGRMAQERNDPSWLTAERHAALDRFLEAGLPGPRVEDWIYTNARRLGRHEFKRGRAIATPEAATLEGNVLDLVAGPRLVFLNGHYDPSLSMTDDLPAGVSLVALDDAMAAAPESLRETIEARDATRGQPLVDLNAAFFEDGAVLRVDPGVVVDGAVQIVFVTTSWQDDVVEHPRVVVSLGESAQLSLLERYEAQGPGVRFTNAVTQVELEGGARLHHVRLQREGSSAFHIGFTEVRQDRDSHYESVSVSLGGALCRQEVQVDLLAPGAHASLSGLAVLGGHEHVDNHTVIHHRVPHCTSREVFKNIVGGQARGAFTGRIVVAEDAQQTNSTQENHNLLLSSDATAETRPQLEIYADDVKCAHGATIGQLDEEQMFYLRSRGLGPLAARNLLIHGFAEEVLDDVTHEGLRDGLAQVLAQRLNVDAS